MTGFSLLFHRFSHRDCLVIMLELAIVLFLAFILDLLLGDPRYRFHPIRLIGRCIALFTRILRRAGLDGRRGGG